MKFRHSIEPVIDGLTEEDMARIRGAAAASVTPGLEGLAERAPIRSTGVLPGKLEASPDAPKGKRGRRA